MNAIAIDKSEKPNFLLINKIDSRNQTKEK